MPYTIGNTSHTAGRAGCSRLRVDGRKEHMSETGVCPECGRMAELAEGTTVCVECASNEPTCPSCGYSALHLPLLKCVACRKVVCRLCGVMVVGGLYACSEECETDYYKGRLAGYQRTRIW